MFNKNDFGIYAIKSKYFKKLFEFLKTIQA